ncbi:MAG: hypothetical protein HPY54_01925 [Chthonomonadetes bacterium]|nr:hypothetical protein [Chthonomonadetes bacterium]
MRRGIMGLVCLLMMGASAMSQTVNPEFDPNEKPGERPYEMVWANRKEPAPPTLTFHNLQGWRMEVHNGAEAVLQVSRAQNVWDRPVAKLRYRGNGQANSAPRIVILPPAPVAIPDGADCVELWVYGNRWSWENPPDTPPVHISVILRDSAGGEYTVQVASVEWKEWWLLHRRLPAGIRFPAQMMRMEVSGGWQNDWREIFFDSVRFYREQLPPLQFAPRPKRNLTLFEGQSPGANTGPGKLPFPTRDLTILPMHFSGAFKNHLQPDGAGRFVFLYEGKDGKLVYRFDASRGINGIRAEWNGRTVWQFSGAGVRFGESIGEPKLKGVSAQRSVISAEYDDGTTLRLQIVQKSLIVDVINRTARATELHFGQLGGVHQPRAMYIPYITYGSSHPTVLLSRAGNRWLFSSIWLDWYRSNGSEPYGAEYASGDIARINGGVRYHPKTDGTRNPMFERLFITVSPMLEEVLPTIANPVGLHAKQAVDRLWQESWGPDNYENQMKRSRMLRAYGIEKLIQCNHEISWRDEGESFTLRTRAAPGKGGDEALKRYVAHQRSIGWFSGLYTNYCDFAPVNEHWNPDFVQRQPDGEWRPAWPRNWALKPLKAVEFDAILAPQIKAKYNPNSAYTDVHTAVQPWWYTDYDARVPGAGTFAQTFYAYGELLRNDSRVYGGPIFSEGTYQWLYAGLADGNYALAYNGRPLAVEPLLPVFDLYQIHTKECDIGMAWTSFFCDAIPNWRAPENIDRAIDRFLLHTLAYGHIGWLVEEEHGIERTCRSYYMLQQVQARYGLLAPARIAYWDGAKLVGVSEAVVRDLPRTRRQLYVEYPNGLKLWLNDHPSEEWRVNIGSRAFILPPAGWLAYQKDALLSYSALVEGRKVDYLRSEAYIYLDGRGELFNAPEASSDGGLAITRIAPNRLQVIHISGKEQFRIGRPFGVQGALVSCRAYDVDGNELARPATHDSGQETWVEPVEKAVRYVLEFSGKRTWSIAPERREVVPGGSVRVTLQGVAQQARWQVENGAYADGVIRIDPDLSPGDTVLVRATIGGGKREAVLRVVEPVRWRWQTGGWQNPQRLTLIPIWRIAPSKDEPLSVEFNTSEGWQVSPRSLRVEGGRMPAKIDLQVRTDLPTGTEGDLSITLRDGIAPHRVGLRLCVTETQPVLTELTSAVAMWGIARRGQKEIPDPGGTGALYYTGDLPVGGVSKKGIFMHPPYTGGVGYTWAELRAITLPNAPCLFHSWIGIRDGGNPSDGVLFRVELIDQQGKVHRLVEGTGIQGTWRELTADLSSFAGQTVRLRLIADVGPNDDSTADWASWGEPSIKVKAPVRTLQVAEAR